MCGVEWSVWSGVVFTKKVSFVLLSIHSLIYYIYTYKNRITLEYGNRLEKGCRVRKVHIAVNVLKFLKVSRPRLLRSRKYIRDSGANK